MLRRIRGDESGFGLVELLIAMIVLAVGILAVIAVFTSGAVALRRASAVSTATAIADAQMERYRALRYAAIGFDAGELVAATADPVYLQDAPVAAQVIVLCASPPPATCDPSRTAPGPDGRSYRVNTYIVERSETSDGRPVKVVTIVVRDEADLAKALVRQQSTFDRSFG